METYIVVIAVLSVLLIALAIVLYTTNSKKLYYEKKYAPVIDIDAAVQESEDQKQRLEQTIESLKRSYKEKKQIFDSLVAQVAVFDEELELAELGFYKPHFDFDSSEVYKTKIREVKDAQKAMVSTKEAVTCDAEWTVEGSKAKGRTMTNRAIRLTARAFNNECDAAIANVTWKNVARMEQRIEKAFESINKLNASNRVSISPGYLKLKLQELRLAYEHRKRKQEEKEEQAAIRQQMREEAKLQQDIEAAEKEERKYEKMLEKARLDAEKASGAKLTTLEERIAELSKELAAAHEKNERAKSMAEQTRSGHVYIISNLGSFGEHVYKIGMTRRLDPQERVKELGDASVPFTFDVHAMIYSEDAPALERELHNVFDAKRVNLVNGRKEFFNVPLDEIALKVKRLSPEAEFVETAEAREYQETQYIRARNREKSAISDVREALPAEL